MTRFRFEWDPEKALSNQEKHGVSFDEAVTVFIDEDARLIADPDHSEKEERFLLVGMSQALRTLVVCHCVKEADTIRLISARKATKRERTYYESKVLR